MKTNDGCAVFERALQEEVGWKAKSTDGWHFPGDAVRFLHAGESRK